MSKTDLENYFIDFSMLYSVSYYNQMLTSVNIIFKLLKQPYKLNNISYKKDSVKLVNILSKQELKDSLRNIKNLKHIVIISTIYLGALRISELLNLKISEVDFQNKRILILKSKNNISGYIPISEKFCNTLKKYITQYKPIVYLIEGREKGKQYSKTSVRNIVKSKIKSNKRLYPHLLRHTALTNLVDDGHNILKVQQFARHTTPKSTNRYYHLSEESLKGMTLTLNTKQ